MGCYFGGKSNSQKLRSMVTGHEDSELEWYFLLQNMTLSRFDFDSNPMTWPGRMNGG